MDNERDERDRMDEDMIDTKESDFGETHIIALLDASSSMIDIKDEVRKGLNGFLKEQRDISQNAVFSLTFFSNRIQEIIQRKPIKEVNYIHEDEYIPHGTTSLYDAIGSALTKYKEDRNVMVVIITDGEENSSEHFNRAWISKLIKDRTLGGWKFIYLCNNLNNAYAGNSIGFQSATRGESNPSTQNLITAEEDYGHVLSNHVSRAVSSYRTNLTVEPIDELNSQISELKLQDDTSFYQTSPRRLLKSRKHWTQND